MQRRDNTIRAPARAFQSVLEGVPALIPKWFACLLLCMSGNAFAQTPGAASLNEPFYPWMGNGGYDVQDYDADVSVAPDLRSLAGSVTITARATQDLSAFNLDFGTPRVTGVNVNGLEARAQHDDPELTVTPAQAIKNGETFRVRVQYTGTPGSKVSTPGFDSKLWNVLFGSLVVMADPNRLMDWLPSNDHPTDKATFTLRLTAPKTLTIAAGGTLTAQNDNPDDTHSSTFRYASPTTTYGVFFSLGNQRLETGDPIGAIKIRHYLIPGTTPQMRQAVAQSANMLRFFEERLGRYPFSEFGVLTHNVGIAFGLETQSLLSLPAGAGSGDSTPVSSIEIVAHKLANQWFGMLVTLREYRDKWLHEGFAQYLSYMYTSQNTQAYALENRLKAAYPKAVNGRSVYHFTKAGLARALKNWFGYYTLSESEVDPALKLLFGASLKSSDRADIIAQSRGGLSIRDFANLIEELRFTRVTVLWADVSLFEELVNKTPAPNVDDRFIAPSRITSGDLAFNAGVHERGALAVHALRLRLGDDRFWALLRDFLERYRFSNASVKDFLNLTRTKAGQDAATLLERWLFDERAPDFPELGLYAKDFALGADFK